MKACIGYAREQQSHQIDPGIHELIYAWLEGMDGACLDHIPPDWQNLARWPRGRIFGPKGEYRWRLVADGNVHAVLLLDEEKLPGPFEGQLALKPADKNDAAQILWGEWVQPAPDLKENIGGLPLYYANEIPGLLSYPLPHDKERLQAAAGAGRTPRLVVRRYCLDLEKSQSRSSDTLMQREFVRCVGFDLRNTEEEKTNGRDKPI